MLHDDIASTASEIPHRYDDAFEIKLWRDTVVEQLMLVS
jgi:hypothetical protein